MKKNAMIFLLMLLLAGGTVSAQRAQKPFDIDLWAQGMPNTNGVDNTPFDESKGNFKPSIRVFLPAAELSTGRVVIACPGGGYSHLAYHHEGYDWAPYFNKQGIALVVLKYRMPFGGYLEVPVSDAEEALKMVRDSADVWNVNRYDVGIMGSSAGGHLASTVATHAAPEVRPNFQILFYPVITMDKSYTHLGSHDNLLGKDASEELEKKYSNEKQVTQETPRAFIVFSDDDKVVPPANGANYYVALNKQNVPASFHVFPSGGHGWGINESFLYKTQMLDALTSWLQTWKAPRSNAIRVACIGNSITFGARIKDRMHDSYPAVLARLLGDEYLVHNYGVSARTMLNKGDHPYMNEPAYRNALAFNPQVVIIKLGTNDSKQHNWQFKADYMKDMQQMIDAFRSLPAHPDIYLCLPAKAYTPEATAGINDSIIVNELIPMIRKVAKKNKLKVIDLHAAMDHMPELFPDQVHPNEKGAEVMAKTVYQAIKQ
ncbi:GDSL-type esterase/lipase family protein [Bacteroides sp.]|uniref:GDSL-type esterase/lipase family protein n=1 Tax=Bacteroides sp. TaxID=29523 RepID=UPI002FC6CF1C